MNAAHPYQPWITTLLVLGIVATVVILLAAGASFANNVQQILEARHNRRLEHRAATEEIRQRLRAAADRINNSGLD